MSLLHVGFDTETHLIGADGVIPRLVCASVDAGSAAAFTPFVLGACEYDQLMPSMLDMFGMCFDAEARIIIQNAAFDLTVLFRWCADIETGEQPGDPKQAVELRRLIFATLDKSMDRELEMGPEGVLISDTIIREKLYNLSNVGFLKGFGIRYDLAGLVKKYFDLDISAKKNAENDPSIWRMRYCELDGIPANQYPPEAYKYALDDATYARDVWVCQEERRADRGVGSMNSESLQVFADTVLRLSSSHGFLVNRSKVDELKQRLEAEVAPDKMKAIYDAGILRPNNTVEQKVLKDIVEKAWASIGRLPMMTKGTDNKAPTTALDKEVFKALEGVDPLLDLYMYRQSRMKLITAFVPNLSGAVVHTNYDVLKETGRTSSFGNDDDVDRKSDYPSVNIQQIPRANGVRECFMARPGHVIVSCDYSALELCSTAQVTYELFGHSVHRDRINAGYKLHNYLGTALAMRLDPALVEYASDIDAAYEIFQKKYKAKIAAGDTTSAAAVGKERATHFRNLAKPTGLGFPGMLGPDTFVAFAKATYDVIVTVEEATKLREFWFATYPEMVEFKKWVGKQENPDGTSEYETSGFKRYRSGATFCATANGKAMQSLSADGAKRGVAWLGTALYGGLPENDACRILEGSRLLAFIHDENLVEMPDDDLMTERSLLVSQIMCNAMREKCMPNVAIEAEPAAMRYWTKKAEPEWADDPDRPERLFRKYGLKPDAIPGVTGGTRRLLVWTDVRGERPKQQLQAGAGT